MARLFVRNLTTLDFAYLDGERGLLGESWRVHIELGGELDDHGMVLDFATVKKGVKQTLDEHFDHRLLVPLQHPKLVLEHKDDTWRLDFGLRDGSRIRHFSPGQALAIIDAPKINASAVVAATKPLLAPWLPRHVADLQLTLEPESLDGPYFHYAHGLKHHSGNCQRIAHGHRSRLEIYRNGQRAPELESAWVECWRDIYIVTREDIQHAPNETGLIRVGYTAGQGAFQLELPVERCYLFDGDSTIENLAQHVAEVLALEHPGDRIRARVFEGVDKGAEGEVVVHV